MNREPPIGSRVAWRGVVADDELMALDEALGGRVVQGWWDRVRPHSLGWATARGQDGELIGFVNVAWDGDRHAFLLDTKVAPAHQRRGLATRLVSLATGSARAAGCEWLHVDYEEHLAAFYERSCGFAPTRAGLIYLSSEPR